MLKCPIFLNVEGLIMGTLSKILIALLVVIIIILAASATFIFLYEPSEEKEITEDQDFVEEK